MAIVGRMHTRSAGVLLALVLASAGCASSASATVQVTVTPAFPSTAKVGATGLSATITVANSSTGPEAAGPVTVSSITLVPSCGSLSLGDCPPADVDPGVFSLSASGVGRNGTACPGTNFSFSTIDANQGKLQLTSASGLDLSPRGDPKAQCVIDFHFGVVRLPAKDSDSGPGLQTAQVAEVSATSPTGSSGSGFTSTEVSVSRATPTIVTHVASAAVTTGTPISDTATMGAAAGSPAPTQTVTFRAYGPTDLTCATPINTSTNTLTGSTASSTAFIPPAAGTYRFVATYNGDSANNPVSGNCGEPNETVVVSAPDEKPAAAYTASTFTPLTGQAVTFDATKSKDPDGSIVTYRWVWGDHTPDTSGPTPTHAFAAAGTYKVGLYITDSASQTANVYHGFTVTAPDEKPAAAYTASTFTPLTGQAVTFDATKSKDPDGSIVTYRWVWNDRTPDASGPTPTHAFAAAGTYKVGLYITDSAGQTANVYHGFTVTAPGG